MAAMIVSAPTARRWAPIALPVLRLPGSVLQIAPLVLALLASPALYLSVTSEAVTTGSSLERLRTEREQWVQHNRQLDYELAKLQSLAWVENEAVTRLGMVQGTPTVYISMDRPRPGSSRSGPASLARHESSPADPLVLAPDPGDPAADSAAFGMRR